MCCHCLAVGLEVHPGVQDDWHAELRVDLDSACSESAIAIHKHYFRYTLVRGVRG
jgi:hypothetical protein